jgi:hypothetical protein
MSHNRACLEEIWSASYMRKPMYEDPSVGESIENHLRDILGREVTICCSDDPWWWVKRDTKVEVYPNLDKNVPNCMSVISDSSSRSLNVVRKCWYHVRWIEAEERTRSALQNQNIDPPSAIFGNDTINSAIGHQSFQSFHVIFGTKRMYRLLENVSSCGVEAIFPNSQPIARVVEEAELLKLALHRMPSVRDDEEMSSNSAAEQYRRFADAVLSLEEMVVPVG